ANFFFPITDKMGDIPLRRISPYAGLLFFLSAMTIVLWLLSIKHRFLINIASWLGVAVMMVGFIAALGYVYGAPFLYGSTIIPMAATTVSGFFLLGCGLVALVGSNSVVLRPFKGNSPAAQLLRTTLPVVIILSLLTDILGKNISTTTSINPALIAALAVVVFVVGVSLVLVHIAMEISKRIEEIELERKLDENRLKDSEQRYRELIEGTDDLITRVDANGVFIYVNQSAEKIFGITPQECIGRSAFDFVHPQDKEMTKKAFQSWVISKLKKVKFQNRQINISGQACEMSWNININYDSDGNIVNIANIAHDISERKKIETALRESEAFFRESQQAAFIGSYKTDFTTGMWDSSEVLDQIFGIDKSYRKDVQGWLDIVHPDDQAMMGMYLSQEVIIAGKSFNKEYRIIRKSDGVTRWVLGLGKVDLNEQGLVVSMSGTVQDITERKNVEEELKKAKENAEAASEAKTEFLYNISHDVRTPLNSILGFSRILTQAQMDEKAWKCIQIIQQQGLNLLSLVEDILHISKLGSGQMTLRSDEFNLMETVQRSIDSARIGIGNKNIVLSCSMPPVIPRLKGDEIRIGQVLNNLLSNAVKYTESGEITLWAVPIPQACADNKYCIQFSISDTGFGIAPDDLPRIFDPFTRFHEFHGGKTYDGVGLGLNITQTLVHLMGG
ncbi:MAG: PAS domain-containing sensor histidine kinase, partial [Candidatus Omnitrophota bacterium]